MKLVYVCYFRLFCGLCKCVCRYGPNVCLSTRWVELKAILALETCKAPHVVSADSRVDSLELIVGMWFWFRLGVVLCSSLVEVFWPCITKVIYLWVYLLYLMLQVSKILMNTLICLCIWLLFLRIYYFYGQVVDSIYFYALLEVMLDIVCYAYPLSSSETQALIFSWASW